MNSGEIYISVDIEASGPIPGIYSMLALGACRVDDTDKTFYVEIQPITDNFVAEALEVSRLSLDRLRVHGTAPHRAMSMFRRWLGEQIADPDQPVFVGFNAGFDWSFVNWYFHSFVGANPFGIGAVDIKSYYMGLSGCRWGDTTSAQLPLEFQPSRHQSHHAREDAQAQAEIFAKLLVARRRMAP